MGPRRRRLIRDHAEHLLEQCGVERLPVDVLAIADWLSIKVISQRIPDSSVSGYYLRRGQERIIGVNANHSLTRRRFTIAHELGHVLLLAHDDLHVDRTVKLRDSNSSQGVDRHEVEANQFAAELLMPFEMIQREVNERGGIDIYDERQVSNLARSFGVSTQALLIRLSDRGFVLSGNPLA